MEPQMRTDPSQRKLRSYSGIGYTWRKHALQSPTSDGRPSSSDICGLPITTQKLTGLTSVSPCLDALLSVKGGQMEAWQRMMDQNPEMQFMPHSSPLSGGNMSRSVPPDKETDPRQVRLGPASRPGPQPPGVQLRQRMVHGGIIVEILAKGRKLP